LSVRHHGFSRSSLHKVTSEQALRNPLIDFAYLGNVVQSIRKPLRQHTATTRKVQTGGLVKFKQQRIQLDLPKGTYVVVLREGQDYLFSLGDQVIFRMTGQEKCHPCI